MLRLAVLLLILVCSWPPLISATADGFLQCLSRNSYNLTVLDVVYLPSNASYLSIWRNPIYNLRFSTPSTPKPASIIVPTHESHVQAVIYCSNKHGLEMRIRSGGHDTEGLSFTSHVPFVVVDLRNFRSVTVNVDDETAWVQAGATLGEVYYNIARKSRTLAFPAGFCPTVGAGGHFSGGGYGMLIRKYGIAADNVIDARIINVDGRILDRSYMGEDLFWAIRGGGGASFGVIIAWRVRLVQVPETVTAFQITRNTSQTVTRIFHQWQSVVPDMPKEVNVVIFVTSNAAGNNSGGGERSVDAAIQSLYLGRKHDMLALMNDRFPELRLKEDECVEMSWIQSVLFFAGFQIADPLENLLVREPPTSQEFFVGKSDYVRIPIPMRSLDEIWKKLHEEDPSLATFRVIAYEGRMSEIPATEIPFPHRAGNLYEIYSTVNWDKDEQTQRHVAWLRRFYQYLTPYVSKNPRAAYLNYRDLDLGTNGDDRRVSYSRASRWGQSYFVGNFERLVKVKTAVDPSNFFRNEQSIPSLAASL